MSAAQWETVIGLEIHAQLATRSKIFSGSASGYGATRAGRHSVANIWTARFRRPQMPEF